MIFKVVAWGISESYSIFLGISPEYRRHICHKFIFIFLLFVVFYYRGVSERQREIYCSSLQMLVNASFTSQYLCVCVCVVIAFKMYYFNNSQVYSTILLSLVTMLYWRFPELIYSVTRFVHFEQYLPVSLLTPPPAPGNHHSTVS